MLFTIDLEKCNYCGICVEACGRKIIEMKSQDVVPTPVAGADEFATTVATAWRSALRVPCHARL